MLNALDLLKEARILYKHRRYARAYALAFTAFEEVGKGQIVADFITGVASKEELQSAFRDHKLKAAYMGRQYVIRTKNPQDVTVEYDVTKTKQLLIQRNAALYVNMSDDFLTQSPKQVFRAKHAMDTIKAVEEKIRFILYAERLNERIGTKAIAK